MQYISVNSAPDRLRVGIAAILTIILFTGSGDQAWAQASLGEMFCNAYDNTKVFGTLFTWISYFAGAFISVQMLFHVQGYLAENKANFPLKGAATMFGGAAALMALPSLVSMLIDTLVTPGGGGIGSCSPESSGGGGQTLDAMLTAFVGNIKEPLITLVSLIGIVGGVWMVVRGTMKASKYGVDPKSNSIHSISANLVFGAILITIGTSLDTILGSLFGSGVTSDDAGVDYYSVLNWGFVSSVGGGSQNFANAITAALQFFQIIGVIAFVRGWLLLKKVVEGGGNASMAQAITHIVGGALAINIGTFLQIMDNTFGTNLL